MLFWDAFIRFGAITVLLVAGAFAVRDGWSSRPLRYAALVCLSLSALLISTAPEALRAPDWLHNTLRFIDIPAIVFIWWFGRALFDDDFRLGWLSWGGFAVYTLAVVPSRLVDVGYMTERFTALGLSVDALSLVMAAHLVYVALAGRGDDLIERRRRLRLVFVLTLAVATALTVLGEIVFAESHPAALSVGRAVPMLMIGLWTLFWLGRVHPEIFRFGSAAVAAPAAPKLDARDAPAHRRLLDIMESGAYAEPGLTIGALADRVGVPEHQLRALINRAMGHRNFTAFLNSYRLDAAKAALADPEQARTPVLTIAMDTGFGSLAPFNRAFKAATSVTPTQFRKAALENPVDPEKG